MANEKFKVKFGLAVGDTAATIDGSSGNIVTSGDIDLQGGDIQNSTGGLTLTTASNADINLTPNGTGDVKVNADTLFVGDAGAPALITTNGAGNLTINTNNGTTSGSIVITTGSNQNIDISPHGTGDVNLNTDAVRVGLGTGDGVISSIGTNDLLLQTNDGANSSQLRVGYGANSNITLTPSGTGDVILSADTVQVGDANATATITTNGTGDLVLNTNNGSSSSSVTITNGANGNISIVPNGTGNINLQTSTGGNSWVGAVQSAGPIASNAAGNLIRGVIRDATTRTNGDMWSFTSGTGTGLRGISIDNSDNTAKAPVYVTRSFTGGAVAGAGTRGRVLFERARGTVAAPTAIQSGDFLGSIDSTGYATDRYISDAVALVPAFFGFTAAENWVNSGTTVSNCGANFALSLQPTATTLATGSQVATITSSPQALGLRGDIFSISQGKTTAWTATGSSISGTTLTIGTLTSGSIAVGQVVNAAAAINGTYIVANISGSGSGSTWTVSQSQTVASTTMLGTVGYIGGSNGNSLDALANLRLLTNTLKASDGTTQMTTSTSGTTLTLNAATFNLNTTAGVGVTGDKLNYNRVFGQWQYDATITPAGANTAYAFQFQGGSAVTDYANIASATNTSRIQPNALGYYNLQFSLQLENTDNAADHVAYIWWRKNGVDIANSMGRVYVTKNNLTIAAWNNVVQATATTDYYELMYAVDNVALRFPYNAATAFGPATAAVFLSIVPVGA